MSRNKKTDHPAFESSDDPVVESLEIGLGRRGKPLDRWVTFRDLKDQGAFLVDDSGVIIGAGGAIGGGAGGGGPADGGDNTDPDFGSNDPTIPPAPTGVSARGIGIDSIGVSWNPAEYSNHAYAEVFASRNQGWSNIRDTFNPERPISGTNSTPYFMGRASGNTFLHTGIAGTVPSIEVSSEVESITDRTGESSAYNLEVCLPPGVAQSTFPVDETIYLQAPTPWPGDGIQGTVEGYNGDCVLLQATFGDVDFSALPPGVTATAIRPTDDLDAALEPDPVYYWIRFVSTAGVVGPVQGEDGASGQVFIDPEAVLNILTGRIRVSSLAQELIAPIGWVSGPVSEYNSVTDFVTALGDEAVTSFSKELWAAYIGEITPGGATGGAALSEIRGELNDTGAFIEALNTLQLGSEGFDGFPDLMATVVQRQLVALDDGGALAYIGDTLQVQVGEDSFSLNEIGQSAIVAGDSVRNSITLRVQQSTGGVLYAAGFGIGLEGAVNDPESLVSTAAFAVDQFALMEPGRGGRLVNSITRSDEFTYRVTVETGSDPDGFDDGLQVGRSVAFAVGPRAPEQVRDAIAGVTFRIAQRSGGVISLVEAEDAPLLPINVSTRDEGYALFPEQSIPFVVDTVTGTIGVRGRLVVDGLIAATRAQIQELAATDTFTGSLTVFGLANTKALIGERIATPRYAGWAMRMQRPGTPDDRVLELSRWQRVFDGLDPGIISTDPNAYPHLAGDEPSDTSFYLTAQGDAYLRGNLTVGGNSRFWTGYQEDPGDFFVQMDQEFPIFIMPRGSAEAGGLPVIDGLELDYTNDMRSAVRSQSLFWVNRDGTAGFNTANGAIFVDDTPLSPPNGDGTVDVKVRLDDGAPTGLGRVMVNSTFQITANRFASGGSNAGDRIGCTYAVFVVPYNVDYTSSEAITPSARGRMTMPNETQSPALENPGYLDNHFVIIRANSNSSGSWADPGYRAFQQWQQEKGIGGFKAQEFFSAAPMGGRTALGAIELPSSGNYKILIAIVERYSQGGVALFGAPTSGNTDQGSAVNVWNASAFVEQVSTIGGSQVRGTTGQIGDTGGFEVPVDPSADSSGKLDDDFAHYKKVETLPSDPGDGETKHYSYRYLDSGFKITEHRIRRSDGTDVVVTTMKEPI